MPKQRIVSKTMKSRAQAQMAKAGVVHTQASFKSFATIVFTHLLRTDWVCCPPPNDDYCGESVDYCSGIPTASNLRKVYRSPKSCQGTMCKGSDEVDWCCPQADWVCCEDKPDSCAFDSQTCESIPDKDKRPGNGLIQDKMFRPWFVRPGY